MISTYHGPVEVKESLHDRRRSERQSVRQLVVDTQLIRCRERLEPVERRTDPPHAEIQAAHAAALFDVFFFRFQVVRERPVSVKQKK